MIIKTGRKLVELASPYGHIFGIRAADGLAEQMPVETEVIPACPTELTLAASQVWVNDYTLSSFKAIDSFTKSSHIACAVRPVDVRQLKFQARPAVADHDIHTVERRRPQADQHFSGLWLRLGEIAVLQHFRSAVLAKEDGLHGDDFN